MNNSTRILVRLSVLVITCSLTAPAFSVRQSGSLTPAQSAVEKQRQRLSATDPEERRDALMQLWAMHRAEASRVAAVGLTDASPMVRAVAAKAILALGPEESVAALTPLVGDKDEFVRREVAYALGQTKSRNATAALMQLLNDKEDGVRAAAAVSSGEVGDETAVVTLANVLSGEANGSTKKKSKGERNIFVLRAVARSLGQIKSRAAVPALITALTNEKFDDDIHREAARSLGMIGDPAAIPALRAAAASADPYLAQTAFESLRKLNP
jgi:HEAT repeat protein